MNKNTILEQIELLLEELPTRDRVELIANVLLREGLAGMDLPGPLATEDLSKEILKHRMDVGETAYNSLAIQGLMMLEWTRNMT